MKYVFTLCLLFTFMSLGAQTINKTAYNEPLGRHILIDLCTRDSVANFPDMRERYDAEYSAYLPDSLVLSGLQSRLNDTHITLVMGTWCGDSKSQVPRFFKILDLLGFDEKRLTIICVDGSKKASSGLLNNLDIKRVPTFIIYDDTKKELGRIVETPHVTLEKDLLNLVLEK